MTSTSERLVRALFAIVLVILPARPSAPAVVALHDPAGEVTGCGGTFGVVADATVDEVHANDALGAQSTLRVVDGASQAYTLLGFDLDDDVPAGAVLLSAYLELTLSQPASPTPVPLLVAETGAWNEATVTWNTAPALNYVYAGQASETVGSVVRVDVGTLIRRWLNGADDSATFAVLPAAEPMGAAFYSREGGGADSPRLVLRCAPPQAAVQGDETAANQAQAADAGRLEQEATGGPSLQFIGGGVRFANFRLPVPADLAPDPWTRADWFLNNYQALFRIDDPSVEFQLIRISSDGQHLFFRQRHDGVPVVPAELAVHFDSGFVSGVGGAYVPGITLGSVPTLPAVQAEALALAAGGEAAELRGDTQLRYLSLDLLGMAAGLHLAWEVHVQGGAQWGTNFIDAHTGDLLFTASQIEESFDLDLEDGNDENSRELCDIWDDDDIDGDDAPPDSGLAVDHYQATHFYWGNTLARDSYDGDGEQMEVNIHVTFTGGANASYTGCDIFMYSRGMVVRDIVGHEFTHAVDGSEAELIYANQSGALDESFADIFGYMLDRSDWLMGEDVTAAGVTTLPNPAVTGCTAGVAAIRDIGNPPCFNHPDHIQAGVSGDGQGLRVLPAGVAPNCGATGNDCGFVHTNSGIHNKAAFLIVAGGSFNTFTVAGMGANKAQHLFHTVLVNRLWSSSQLIDARNAAVAVALDLASSNYLGFNSTDVCTVRNAYAAVGLPNGDRDCDGLEDNVDPDQDGDFDPDAVDNCPTVWNPSQLNTDGNGPGDACDPDDDDDGVLDNADNCRTVANAGQANWNGDAEGDACDDSDGDDRMDNNDNCLTNFNPLQEDQDLDNVGDACDPDLDGDGVNNPLDNCARHANPLQEDTTETDLDFAPDGIGNACDLCPTVTSPDNTDLDRDGLANPCDDDDDGDGALDNVDNCPITPNPGQLDWDDNGAGFACDPGEQATFGSILEGVNQRYVRLRSFRTPLPVCPSCTAPYLAARFEMLINVQLPIGFKARVVDSSGAVVAKGLGTSQAQTLRISPRAFASTQLAGVGAQALPDGASALPFTEFGPDEIRYYLEIEAAPGTDLDQLYPLTLSVEERIAGGQVHLPLVLRP